MTAIKKSKLKILEIEIGVSGQPVHTVISYSLCILCILVMGLFTVITIINDDPNWRDSSLMQLAFCSVGLLGTQLLAEQPLFPKKDQFKKVDITTGIKALIIAGIGMIVQLISKAVLSFTALEQAVYFVFAAIAEEVFFRGFILILAFKIDSKINKSKNKKFSPLRLIAVLIQAIIFLAIHQNYYGNLPMQVSVFIGGLVLGIAFLLTEDLTANILAHFLINIIAVQNILVTL